MLTFERLETKAMLSSCVIGEDASYRLTGEVVESDRPSLVAGDQVEIEFDLHQGGHFWNLGRVILADQVLEFANGQLFGTPIFFTNGAILMDVYPSEPVRIDGRDIGAMAITGEADSLCDSSVDVAVAWSSGVTLHVTDAWMGTAEPLLSDVDGNGCVGFSDFLVLSSSFGEHGEALAADLDGNHVVDFVDFLQLSSEFGMCE